MKVVEINKTTSASNTKHYLLITDEQEDDIEYYVKKWCDKDPSGYHNGYSCDWDIVTDVKVMRDVIAREIKLCNSQIESLNSRSDDLSNFLNTI